MDGGIQLYPKAQPRDEGHHTVTVTSALAKELRIRRLRGEGRGQQLSVWLPVKGKDAKAAAEPSCIGMSTEGCAL